MQDSNDSDIVVLTHTATTNEKNEPLNGSCKTCHLVTLAQ